MKKGIPIAPGCVAESKAGRDQGRLFIVLSLDGEEFAYVADGDLRKAEKPKRKRVKHLRIADAAEASLQKRLLAGQMVENHELRACLTAFKQKEG